MARGVSVGVVSQLSELSKQQIVCSTNSVIAGSVGTAGTNKRSSSSAEVPHQFWVPLKVTKIESPI